MYRITPGENGREFGKEGGIQEKQICKFTLLTPPPPPPPLPYLPVPCLVPCLAPCAPSCHIGDITSDIGKDEVSTQLCTCHIEWTEPEVLIVTVKGKDDDGAVKACTQAVEGDYIKGSSLDTVTSRFLDVKCVSDVMYRDEGDGDEPPPDTRNFTMNARYESGVGE